ncbi:MAG: hypothetical protein ACYTGH_17600 [Planctomycetota bacterium]|jgi:hypothetical protein
MTEKPRHHGKKRLARCMFCCSRETYIVFPYQFHWYRSLRKSVKLGCRDCRKSFHVIYP